MAGMLKWDYPERISDVGRELSSIPYEVYEEIFLYFEPRPENFDPEQSFDLSDCKRTLIHISSACLLFRVIVLPFMFRTILIPGKVYPSHTRPRAVKLYRFCEEIVKAHDPQSTVDSSKTSIFLRCVVRYVKQCVFLEWSIDEQYCTEFVVYLRALCHFANLQRLVLQRMSLPACAELFRTSLPHLKNVTDLCLIGCDEFGQELRHFSSYSFVRLHLTGREFSDPGRLTHCHYINPKRLEELQTDSYLAFQALAKRGPMHSLRVLHVAAPRVYQLAQLQFYVHLGQARNLVELYLDSILWVDPLAQEASLQFENLKRLSCPDRMIPLFAFPATDADVALRTVRLYPAFDASDSDSHINALFRYRTPSPICYTVITRHVAACLTDLTIPYLWLLGEYRSQGGAARIFASHFEAYFPRLEILSIFDHAQLDNSDFFFTPGNQCDKRSAHDRKLLSNLIEACKRIPSLKKVNISVDRCFSGGIRKASKGPEIPWNLPHQLQILRTWFSKLPNPQLRSVSFTPQIRWTRVGSRKVVRAANSGVSAGSAGDTVVMEDPEASCVDVEEATSSIKTGEEGPTTVWKSQWIPHVPYSERHSVIQMLKSERQYLDYEECFERAGKGLW
ncbi:hypothetical protein D9758_009533 [Tetrapyrgos nigripes]|uniref:Uncharacterized protein n=1 Tax=Tetrapyrgos nigripes TaxID=182062 RepID=A0A8H5G167_9AGAR|nr:hypothetical protein D9758_009533 [Tetrapyrgos nigripes]